MTRVEALERVAKVAKNLHRRADLPSYAERAAIIRRSDFLALGKAINVLDAAPKNLDPAN